MLKLKSLLDQTQAEGERIKQESIELKKNVTWSKARSKLF